MTILWRKTWPDCCPWASSWGDPDGLGSAFAPSRSCWLFPREGVGPSQGLAYRSRTRAEWVLLVSWGPVAVTTASFRPLFPMDTFLAPLEERWCALQTGWEWRKGVPSHFLAWPQKRTLSLWLQNVVVWKWGAEKYGKAMHSTEGKSSWFWSFDMNLNPLTWYSATQWINLSF